MGRQHSLKLSPERAKETVSSRTVDVPGHDFILKISGPISGATDQKRQGYGKERNVREGDAGRRFAIRNGSIGDVENIGRERRSCFVLRQRPLSLLSIGALPPPKGDVTSLCDGRFLFC